MLSLKNIPIVRPFPITLNISLSLGSRSDVVGRPIGSQIPKTTEIHNVYRINISEPGDLAIINSSDPIEDFLENTTLPIEGGTVDLANRGLARPSNNISYTFARDSNLNGQLDDDDDFYDVAIPASNIAGTAIFNKAVSSGTYFLEILDTNGEGFSVDEGLVLFDPGGRNGVSSPNTIPINTPPISTPDNPPTPAPNPPPVTVPNPPPVLRPSSIPGNFSLPLGRNSDVVGRRIGSEQFTSLEIHNVYRIDIPEPGDLVVINSSDPIEVFLENTALPPEGGTVDLTNRGRARPSNNISYTLAGDANRNGQLDDGDDFYDLAIPTSNIAGTAIFNKAVVPGTYFLEILDTNGADLSVDESLILFDPGGRNGEPLISDVSSGTHTNATFNRIEGTIGKADRITGTLQNDEILGKSGNDVLIGKNGNDILIGDAGRDRLKGGNGKDSLIGGSGRDQLFGDKGKDTLEGGGGSDLLDGGLGKDIIITGGGSDRIVIRRGQGLDRVRDFNSKRDKIDLRGIRFNQLTIQNKQDDVLIKFEGQNLLRLEDIKLQQINQSDFV
ncbi:MAG: calcium-binding protein [Cyanobacteria bacterium P01_F01_bin.150]